MPADAEAPFVLPQGLDYADGVTTIPVNPIGAGGDGYPIGTPDAPIEQYDNGTDPQRIQEEDGSPETERAEQCTNSHSQIMPVRLAYSFLQSLGRGTFVQDSSLVNYFRILSAKVTRIGKSAPGFARLTTVAESISFDTPPDDFWIDAVDLGVGIIKNPRYFTALYPTTTDVQPDGSVINDFTEVVGGGTVTVAQVKMAVIRAIQTYQDSPFFPSSNTINGQVQNNIIQSFVSGIVPVQINQYTQQVVITGGGSAAAIASCQLAIAAAGEIIQNIWYGEDAPFVPGFEVNWTQRFFFSPWLNPGCYVEDPLLVLPDYFSNPASMQQQVPNTGNPGSEVPSPVDSPTIFDEFVTWNPQYFSDDGTPDGNVQYSALRKPDVVRFNRTWFDLTHSWLVSPIGHWNPLIFSGGNRPQVASDYQPLQ